MGADSFVVLYGIEVVARLWVREVRDLYFVRCLFSFGCRMKFF